VYQDIFRAIQSVYRSSRLATKIPTLWLGLAPAETPFPLATVNLAGSRSVVAGTEHYEELEIEIAIYTGSVSAEPALEYLSLLHEAFDDARLHIGREFAAWCRRGATSASPLTQTIPNPVGSPRPPTTFSRSAQAIRRPRP